MTHVIDLLVRMPRRPGPMELGKILEPMAPFLGPHRDSFEAWVLQRNYELGEPPLSREEVQILRKRWRK